MPAILETKSNTEKLIKGITWGHSRGYTPLVAAAQRFAELHPGTTIIWEQRTLQQFADFPIEALAKIYDLLIIDHPWVGTAAATGAVLPLDQHLPADYIAEQADNSVGYSHQSYFYGGHQWALAIDAATPVASYRPDLLARAGVKIPDTWNEVLALARKGRVAVPAIPIDLLMNFYMFCIAHGSHPFQTEAGVVDPATGQAALETMRELYGNIDKKLFHANPIAVAEYMSTTDDYWYCPFAYGYSNYSRDGYARHRLEYADLVFFDPTTNQNQTNQISPNPTPTNPSPTPPTSPAAVHDQAGVGMPWLAHRMANSNHPKSSGNRIRATDGDVPTRPSEELQPAATAKPHREPRRLRSTIGGTGLSISATSRHPTECLAFAQWIVSPECQSTFYTEHGGQPGHRQAWLNEKTNRLTHNYFYTVLPAMERGYMRPRYHGYLYFQDHGGDPIREYLLGNKDCRSTLQCLDQLYHESLKKNPTTQTV